MTVKQALEKWDVTDLPLLNESRPQDSLVWVSMSCGDSLLKYTSRFSSAASSPIRWVDTLLINWSSTADQATPSYSSYRGAPLQDLDLDWARQDSRALESPRDGWESEEYFRNSWTQNTSRVP